MLKVPHLQVVIDYLEREMKSISEYNEEETINRGIKEERLKAIEKAIYFLVRRVEKLEQQNDYPDEAELKRMPECEGTE